MQLNLVNHGYTQHADLFQRTVGKRIQVDYSSDGMIVEFIIDATIGARESYLIKKRDNGWSIIGSDNLGLYYGIGKFLHTATWRKQEFIPNPPQKLMTPACSFRAFQCSVHFFNWYQNASEEDIIEYLEELLLWGYNGVLSYVTVHLEGELLANMYQKVEKIFRAATKVGMKKCLSLSPNQGPASAPHEFDADLSFDPHGVRGTLGRNLCLAKEGTMDYMRSLWRPRLERFAEIGIDYIMMWPYDEGGCGCEKCRPWGANMYCEGAKAIREEAMQFYPNAKYILATWLFDAPSDEGEFEGLYQRLEGDMSWADYILADSHADFPRYPLEHEVIKPIINFPEISMWKLYPWGGFGANPMPERFQHIWDGAKHILQGGLVYSEGIFEDILKVQCCGYYWEPNKNYRDILSEYINYEYSDIVCEDTLELIACLEQNHVAAGNDREPNVALAVRAGKLAREIDERLDERAKKAWRWRILYIRGILDQKRHEYYREHGMKGKQAIADLRHYSGDFLADDDEAQILFKELRTLYHSVEYNGANQFILPPVNGGTVCAAKRNYSERIEKR